MKIVSESVALPGGKTQQRPRRSYLMRRVFDNTQPWTRSLDLYRFVVVGDIVGKGKNLRSLADYHQYAKQQNPDGKHPAEKFHKPNPRS